MSVQQSNHGWCQVLFDIGDLVWLYMPKERFRERRKSKLSPRGDVPFKVLKKVGDNAYVLELPEDYGVSPIFNVEDLTPYTTVNDVDDSRTSPFQEGEIDEGSSPPIAPTFDGPIARSKLKELQGKLNTFISYILEQEEDKSEDKTMILVTNIAYV